MNRADAQKDSGWSKLSHRSWGPAVTIRFITDSQRVKVLRSLHRENLPDHKPLSPESIDFLFDYIETLETELERTTDMRFTDTIGSLAEQDSYYMARATAGLKGSQD
jgi:hypothetical protein